MLRGYPARGVDRTVNKVHAAHWKGEFMKMSVLLLLAAVAAQALGSVNARILTELDKKEIYLHAQAFHDGKLWVGRSRGPEGNLYQVEAYSPEGKLLGTTKLPHSASFIYPYGPGRVIVLGKNS